MKTHKTAQDAYNETVKDNVIAVKRVTYIGEEKSVEYLSFECHLENPTKDELNDCFPYSLGSNQYIEEIDQFD